MRLPQRVARGVVFLWTFWDRFLELRLDLEGPGLTALRFYVDTGKSVLA